MPALGIFVAVLLAALVVGLLTPRVFAAAPPPSATRAAPAKLTRQQLEERLTRLAQTVPDKVKDPTAKCYAVTKPQGTADYVCPIDGSRTHYSLQSALLVRRVPEMRKLAKKIAGLDVSLDERELCRKCRPKGDASVTLVVRFLDGQEVRTKGVEDSDVQLLGEFVSGKYDKLPAGSDNSWLGERMPRLRELLGIQDVGRQGSEAPPKSD